MNTPIKILLVDDDVRNAGLLRRFLEAEGYEVAFAANGREGYDIYKTFSPDLILLDINMPEMNGFELAAAIRRSDTQTIIFFLTDRTEKADRLHGFRLKGNDYIPKPFYPEELIARIKERFESDEKDYTWGETLFSPGNNTIEWRGDIRQLSVRQTEILQLLADACGRPVARETILKRVWGDASYANSLALNVQITYLRRLIADPAISIVSIKKKGYFLAT